MTADSWTEIIIILSAILLFHLYIFWRTGSVLLKSKNFFLRMVLGLGVFLGAFCTFFLVRLFDSGDAGKVARTIKLLGYDWIAVLPLCFVLLFVIEIGTGFGLFFTKQAPILRRYVLAFIFAVSLVAMVQAIRPPVVQNYDVSLSGLPDELDGTVLVAISDTHIGSLIGKSWMEARVEQIQAQNPDLVVLLGDIIQLEFTPLNWDVAEVLGKLTAPMGVWAVLGNHESYYDRQDTIISIFDAAGIKTLRNSWGTVQPGLVLAGVDTLGADNYNGQGEDPVSIALKDRPAGAAILLSHIPWQADRAAAMGAGLIDERQLYFPTNDN